MRTHHEQELKQEFVGVGIVGGDRVSEMAKTVLTTDLAEFAWPIGKDSGKAGVRQMRVGGMAAAVEAPTNRPPSVGAIFSIGIETESVQRCSSGVRASSSTSCPQRRHRATC